MHKHSLGKHRNSPLHAPGPNVASTKVIFLMKPPRPRADFTFKPWPAGAASSKEIMSVVTCMERETREPRQRQKRSELSAVSTQVCLQTLVCRARIWEVHLFIKPAAHSNPTSPRTRLGARDTAGMHVLNAPAHLTANCDAACKNAQGKE